MNEPLSTAQALLRLRFDLADGPRAKDMSDEQITTKFHIRM